MKLAIGSDHAGFQLKEVLKAYLSNQGHELEDFGTASEDSVDYPDFAHPVANEVENGGAELGILVCGSGNGVNMSANKHEGIRSALSWEPEIASLARQHNDANVVAIPARFITEESGKAIVDAFIAAEFEGGRHARRVEKIKSV